MANESYTSFLVASRTTPKGSNFTLSVLAFRGIPLLAAFVGVAEVCEGGDLAEIGVAGKDGVGVDGEAVLLCEVTELLRGLPSTMLACIP
jgi:hypothetical protein